MSNARPGVAIAYTSSQGIAVVSLVSTATLTKAP
jgi:hypothetical protein